MPSSGAGQAGVSDRRGTGQEVFSYLTELVDLFLGAASGHGTRLGGRRGDDCRGRFPSGWPSDLGDHLTWRRARRRVSTPRDDEHRPFDGPWFAPYPRAEKVGRVADDAHHEFTGRDELE